MQLIGDGVACPPDTNQCTGTGSKRTRLGCLFDILVSEMSSLRQCGQTGHVSGYVFKARGALPAKMRNISSEAKKNEQQISSTGKKSPPVKAYKV